MDVKKVTNKHRLPDFLIVGAMKSGTSTLSSMLRAHSLIQMPKHELHYFDNDEHFQKGDEWYSTMVTKGCEYPERIDSLLIGEKTPAYSLQPNCPERIKSKLPNTKLIWIFRNPVERTFSNYLHAKKYGSEIRSFSYCIAKEKERLRTNTFKGYVERSKYVLYVERFLEHFDISRMHFMLFENLIRSPQAEIKSVLDFLTIPYVSELPLAHSNTTIMPFFPFSLWLVRNFTDRQSKLYKLISKINLSFPRRKPKIDNKVYLQLESIFEPYNQRLSDFTGLNLAPWKRNKNVG